jgi:flagellar hook-length control protein FliK
MMTPPVAPSLPFVRRPVENEKASTDAPARNRDDAADVPGFLPALMGAMAIPVQPQQQELKHQDVKEETTDQSEPNESSGEGKVLHDDSSSSGSQPTSGETPVRDNNTIVLTTAETVVAPTSKILVVENVFAQALHENMPATQPFVGKSAPASLEVDALAGLMKSRGELPLDFSRPPATAAKVEQPYRDPVANQMPVAQSKPVQGGPITQVLPDPPAESVQQRQNVPSPAIIDRLGVEEKDVTSVTYTRAEASAKPASPPVPQSTMLGVGERRFIFHIARTNMPVAAARPSDGTRQAALPLNEEPAQSHTSSASEVAKRSDTPGQSSEPVEIGQLSPAKGAQQQPVQTNPALVFETASALMDEPRPQPQKNSPSVRPIVERTEPEKLNAVRSKNETSETGADPTQSGKSPLASSPTATVSKKLDDTTLPLEKHVTEQPAQVGATGAKTDSQESAVPATSSLQDVHGQVQSGMRGGAPPSLQPDVPLSKVQNPVRSFMEPQNIYRAVEDKLMTGISAETIQRLREGVSELKLRLSPESLGEMSLKVRLTDDKITAQIQVTQPDVRNALEADLPRLREALAARGLNVNTIDISSSGDAPARESYRQQSTRHQPSTKHREIDAADDTNKGTRLMGYNTIEITM